MERLVVTDIPLHLIHPNPWNPNKLSERVFQAVRESILEHGFVSPATVRDHPERPGEYEIIDSEHRYKTLVALQDEEPDDSWHPSVLRLLSEGVMPCVNLGNVSDAKAKKLTVTLNETRGRADTMSLSTLLSELAREMTTDELMSGLPYTSDELNELLDIGNFDWSQYENAPAEEAEEVPEEADEPFTEFTVSMPASAYRVFEEAYEKVKASLEKDGYRLNKDVKVANGQVIEALAAEYLASSPVEE